MIQSSLKLTRKRRDGGMVLLEVTVAVVILAISVVTLMRSFTLSMQAIRKNDISTQACILADTLLQSLEVNAPEKGKSSGTFEQDGFPKYSWEMDVKNEEIKYKDVKTLGKVEELKELKHVVVKIIYNDGQMNPQTPVETHLILPPVERFSYQSKFLNELFKDEAR